MGIYLSFLDLQAIASELGFGLLGHGHAPHGNYSQTRRGRKRAWGRLANLAGARQIWRMCASSDAAVCLVLEDDAEFTAREAHLLHAMLQGHLLSSTKQDDTLPWDVLQLGLSPLSASYRTEEEDAPHAAAEDPDRQGLPCGPDTAAQVCRRDWGGKERAAGRAAAGHEVAELDWGGASSESARAEPRPPAGGPHAESALAHRGPMDQGPEAAMPHQARTRLEAEAQEEAEATGMRWVRKVRGSLRSGVRGCRGAGGRGRTKAGWAEKSETAGMAQARLGQTALGSRSVRAVERCWNWAVEHVAAWRCV